eukprot:COSAG04_NODE_7065_length_1198_cov_1.185623_2_plen_242_part_00
MRKSLAARDQALIGRDFVTRTSPLEGKKGRKPNQNDGPKATCAQGEQGCGNARRGRRAEACPQRRSWATRGRRRRRCCCCRREGAACSPHPRRNPAERHQPSSRLGHQDRLYNGSELGWFVACCFYENATKTAPKKQSEPGFVVSHLRVELFLCARLARRCLRVQPTALAALCRCWGWGWGRGGGGSGGGVLPQPLDQFLQQGRAHVSECGPVVRANRGQKAEAEAEAEEQGQAQNACEAI